MIARWWHAHVLKHTLDWRRVSPPLWDVSARGDLITCSCGKDWAL